MKRYIRAAKTPDDFKIMLKQYKHRQDFNNCDDAELADLLDDLKHKGAAHDIYQHKKGGGCTVFYDDVTGSEACTVAAAAGSNWGRVKKLLESEFDRGVPDPIFDAGAKVGKKVLPLMDAVQKQLKVDFDGEFYDGDGVIEFVTVGDDPELVADGIDFQTFYRKLIGMIMEANSAEDFKQRYAAYLTELISDTPEYDPAAAEQRHNENWRMRNDEHPGWAHRDFATSDEGQLFIDSLLDADIPYDFIGDRKGGMTVWYPADSTVSSATVVGSEPTPEYALYQNNKNKNKYIEVKRSKDGHSWFRPFVYWNTDRGPVKNYSGSKTNRGRYHRATKDTLQKVLDEYTQVDDVHTEYDDPADLMSATSVTAAETQRMTDFQLEHLLELADDMFYQIHENYRYDDYSRKDIIDMVIEHVIMVITEMDDDGVYEELLPFASNKNRQFMKNLKEHLDEMYDTVEWGA